MPVVGEEIRQVNVGGVLHPIGEDTASDLITVTKDTNGWIGKNFLKIPSSFRTQTVNGVTFTVNRNSLGNVTSIVLSGTATELAEVSFNMDLSRLEDGVPYYLTGWDLVSASGNKVVKAIIHPSSGSDVELGILEERKIYTYAQGITAVFKISVDSGVEISATLYPMLSRTSLGDLTFEPYHDTTDTRLEQERLVTEESLRDTVGQVGKDLLPDLYGFTEQTVSGITFKAEDDGTVTLSGRAATGSTNAKIVLASGIRLEPGEYYPTIQLTEKTTGYVYDDNVWITLYKPGESSQISLYSGSMKVTISQAADYELWLTVKANTDLTNGVYNVYPAILWEDSIRFALNKVDSYARAVNSRLLTVEGKIPSEASSSNKLATASDVNAARTESRTLLKDTVGWTGKNEFDNHQTFFEGFIDTGTNTFTQQPNYYMGTVPINPNTKYDILKQAGKTFRIALSADKPASGVSFRYTEADHTGTEITITTGATDKYLSVLFWSQNNGDTGTYQEMADTVMVKKASITDSTFEPYHPSVEQTLRDAKVVEGKNRLHIPDDVVTKTSNGITYTINRNSRGEVTSIVANGTATNLSSIDLVVEDFADSVLSGCPATGSNSTYKMSYIDIDHTANQYNDYGNGVALPSSLPSVGRWTLRIVIYSGYTANNLTFKPMICSESEWNKSHDFEPFYIPLKDSKFDRAEQAVLGAKNFLKYPYYSGSRLVHPNGITFTVDDNGVIDLDGTATDNCNYNIAYPTDTYLKAGRYILSKGNAQTGVTIWINVFNGSTFVKQVVSVANSAEESSAFDLDFNGYDKIQIGCQIDSGTTVSHVKTYPMLRLASDPDDTYVPYAMTNRELTEVKRSAFTDIISGATVTEGSGGNYIEKSGNVVTAQLGLTGVTIGAWSSTIAKVPDGYKPKRNTYFIGLTTSNAVVFGAILPNGNIQVSTSLTNQQFILTTMSWIAS